MALPARRCSVLFSEEDIQYAQKGHHLRFALIGAHRREGRGEGRRLREGRKGIGRLRAEELAIFSGLPTGFPTVLPQILQQIDLLKNSMEKPLKTPVGSPTKSLDGLYRYFYLF